MRYLARVTDQRTLASPHTVRRGRSGTVIIDSSTLAQLSSQHAITRVWPNEGFMFPYTPDVGAVGVVEKQSNWGADYLLFKQLHRLGADGTGIKVGIADSGLDTSHEMFSDLNLKAFADIDLQDGSVNVTAPFDSGWHGTHCAGCLCGQDPMREVIGAAPKAELYVAKALERWSGSVLSVHSAIKWLSDQGCKIISLSFGWPGLRDAWCDVISAFLDQGGLIFAGIGNDYNSEFPTISPANYPLRGIVAVGAHARDGTIWHRSGGGLEQWPGGSEFTTAPAQLKPDLVGPGIDIVSASPGATYRLEAGTSMATPHVAGIAACIWSVAPNAPCSTILSVIESSLDDAGAPGDDARAGRGRLNALRLVAEIQLLLRGRMVMPVYVSSANLLLSGDGKARIQSSDLLNALVQDSQNTVPLLQAHAPSVQLADISVDENGLVVVSNNEFESYIKGVVCNPVGAVGNVVCGRLC